MASAILGIPEVSPTQDDKTTTINELVAAVEGSQEDWLAVDLSGGDVTLTALQYTRSKTFICEDAVAARLLITPMTKRVFGVRNAGSYDVTVGGITGTTVVVAAGEGAIIQNDGTDCSVFGSGGVGPTGPTGPPGGGISIALTFSTTTTNSDPGNGVLRLDNATQSSATAIYIDLLDDYGTDWTAALDTLDASTNVSKGEIRLFKASDPSKWLLFTLDALVSQTGYRELTVTAIDASAASPLTNADDIMFTFSRTGDGASLGAVNTWTKAQIVTPVALVDGAAIAIDLADSNNFYVTLGGNRTLSNPSNMVAGQGGVIEVIQDGTGGRTLAFDTYYQFASGTAPTLSTAADAVDVLSYYVRASDKIIILPALNIQ